jgi:hypothetical protein
VRTVEITYGQVNGWHPHLHWLDFWEEPLSWEEVAEYQRLVYGAWSRSVVRQGLARPSVEHGVKILGVVERKGAARLLGDYMTEMSPVSAAAELTSLSTKRAKLSGLGPFDILRRLQVHDTDPWLRVWNEYERGTRGRRMLGASHGLLDRIGVSSEDPEPVEAGEVVAFVTSDDWGRIRFFGMGVNGAQLKVEAAAVDGQIGVDEAVRLLMGGAALPVVVGPDSVQLELEPIAERDDF